VTGILHQQRRIALAVITLLVIAASAASFAESYRGLYLWAHHHGLTGIWAAAWPLQVDTFIAVGELALFVALVDQWKPRARASAWAVTLAGLAVSVAGNIGHVTSHAVTARGTAAIPPLAAAAALAVGLGVLKRVVEKQHRAQPQPQAAPQPQPQAASARTGPGKQQAPVARTSRPRAPVTPEHAQAHFAELLAAGAIPSLRTVRSELHVGTDRARELRTHLASLNGHAT
jgi:Protein of unknown function (DUF2637)